jgi:hypothetical protein
VVEDAEAPFAQLPTDIYVLRWTGLSVKRRLPVPLVAMECTLLYSTAGSSVFGGLDRGRLLTVMDAEVSAMLMPACVQKTNSTTNPAALMETEIFWSDPVYLATESLRDRLTRMVKVTVYSYEEPGEI